MPRHPSSGISGAGPSGTSTPALSALSAPSAPSSVNGVAANGVGASGSGSGSRGGAAGNGAGAAVGGSSLARVNVNEEGPLPHIAEDLAADDDLLSWILVDQLGVMPDQRLGVHPMGIKFVGPRFKREEIMEIMHETIIKGFEKPAINRLLDSVHIQAHLKAKRTDAQRDRFTQHLRRYLLPYQPTSRIDIHTTDRYSHITLHPELAVYATRPLSPGVVLHELQGSVAPLPEEWRIEMDLSDDFVAAQAAGVHAAGVESDDEDEDGETTRGGGVDDEDEDDQDVTLRRARAVDARKGKGKQRAVDTDRGARRSGRTRRRDFSIIWSELKRCYQLFLGPARFLNHDCSPNVELLRQGKYVTFRVIRPIRIGDELTTFYGSDYFGPNNIECLCLSCEINNRGPYALKPKVSRSKSIETSRSGTPATPVKNKPLKPSALRQSVGPRWATINGDDASDVASSLTSAGPSKFNQDDEMEIDELESTDDELDKVESAAGGVMLAELVEEVDDDETDGMDAPEHIPRERLSRLAKINARPFVFKYRQNSTSFSSSPSFGPGATPLLPQFEEDLAEDFPRCATCVRPLHDRVWYGGRYFEHCSRCTRHAFIFDLPWPAHKANEVQEYPPGHLIPPNYVPVRITTVPLPSLSKKRTLPIPAEVGLEDGQPVTKEYRVQIKLRKEIALEELVTQTLRETAWAAQMAHEDAIAAQRAAEEARVEAKKREKEEKKRIHAYKEKGSGVWSRYVIVTEEQLRQKAEEESVVRSGTRRGGRYKREEWESVEDRELREARERCVDEWDRREREVEGLRGRVWEEERGGREVPQGLVSLARKGKGQDGKDNGDEALPAASTSAGQGKADGKGQGKGKAKGKGRATGEEKDDKGPKAKRARQSLPAKMKSSSLKGVGKGRKSLPLLGVESNVEEDEDEEEEEAVIKPKRKQQAASKVGVKRKGKATGKGMGKGKAKAISGSTQNENEVDGLGYVELDDIGLEGDVEDEDESERQDENGEEDELEDDDEIDAAMEGLDEEDEIEHELSSPSSDPSSIPVRPNGQVTTYRRASGTTTSHAKKEEAGQVGVGSSSLISSPNSKASEGEEEMESEADEDEDEEGKIDGKTNGAASGRGRGKGSGAARGKGAVASRGAGIARGRGGGSGSGRGGIAPSTKVRAEVSTRGTARGRGRSGRGARGGRGGSTRETSGRPDPAVIDNSSITDLTASSPLSPIATTGTKAVPSPMSSPRGNPAGRGRGGGRGSGRGSTRGARGTSGDDLDILPNGKAAVLEGIAQTSIGAETRDRRDSAQSGVSAASGVDSADGAPKRKRGRPRGSGHLQRARARAEAEAEAEAELKAREALEGGVGAGAIAGGGGDGDMEGDGDGNGRHDDGVDDDMNGGSEIGVEMRNGHGQGHGPGIFSRASTPPSVGGSLLRPAQKASRRVDRGDGRVAELDVHFVDSAEVNGGANGVGVSGGGASATASGSKRKLAEERETSEETRAKKRRTADKISYATHHTLIEKTLGPGSVGPDLRTHPAQMKRERDEAKRGHFHAHDDMGHEAGSGAASQPGSSTAHGARGAAAGEAVGRTLSPSIRTLGFRGKAVPYSLSH